jgi:hypothetical protein
MYWQTSRTDNRFYYIKDHLGSTRLGEGASRSQIRVTLDENADVAGAQDYYPTPARLWRGEVIQGGSFKRKRHRNQLRLLWKKALR